MTGTMKWAAILAAAVCGVGAEAAEVEVLGDRVNLRARPLPESEVAGQVNTGVLLESRGVEGDWVKVAPPPTVGLWVAAEFVKDGKVVPAKLNVRAGAGINYPTVGTIFNGDSVTVRKKAGEWLEIAPPTNASLWIAREFVKERVAPAPAVPASVAEKPVPAPAPAPRPPVARVPAPVIPPDPAPLPPDLGQKGLVPLEGQGETMEREGVLRKTWLLDFGRASNYCLMDVERGRPVTVCYIRGNNAQLKEWEGRRMKVKGEGYWIKGSAKPVIVPRQIMPLSDAP